MLNLNESVDGSDESIRLSETNGFARQCASLSADALIGTIRRSFELVGETRKCQAQIPIEDAPMLAFAMFSLWLPRCWLLIKGGFGSWST